MGDCQSVQVLYRMPQIVVVQHNKQKISHDKIYVRIMQDIDSITNDRVAEY